MPETVSNRPLPRDVVTTSDGSHSLFVPQLNEHYHSSAGALEESLFVFVEAGLHAATPKPHLRVLEIGFGTGLNALCSLVDARNRGLQLHYTGIEKYPVSEAEAQQLNFTSVVKGATHADFLPMHTAAWNQAVEIGSNFTLHKVLGDVQTADLPTPFDVCYFDAFPPEIQPELWTESIFAKLYQFAAPGAVMTTYCAQGQMRRNMKAAGWLVERLPGPPAKRHIIRARKP